MKLGCVPMGLLAVFLMSFSSAAYAADLNALTSVDVGGAHIVAGATVDRDSFSSLSQFWTFNFSWPNAAPNNALAVFRGTFGNLEGGTLQNGINYRMQTQPWAAGNNSIVKQYALPMLGDLATASGTYTVVVAELPASGYSHGNFLNWFQSGGTTDGPPPNYSTLTFNYSATSNPQELAGAITSVLHGGRTIADIDAVYRKEISSGETNFWNFRFNWPNFVDNQRALFMVFRGTFGNIEGGVPVQNANYAYNLQVWPAGVSDIQKQINLPLLRSASTTPSIYTVMVAERDPKYVASSPALQAEWFASGGTSGVAPKKYSLMTFDYKKYEECCSSVVFLPGIQGSRLVGDILPLWPPLIPAKISDTLDELALNTDGTSLNNIRVDGIIDNFYGIAPVYSDFSSFMDGLVSGGTIIDWEPLAYDWRYVPNKVVSDGVQTTSGHVDLAARVATLAENSDTGQVTIVAHSMGGLVGKALIKRLESEGRASLIDSFVMVGSPQLGTPQAIAGLLHGDGQGIPGGLPLPGIIVDPSTARSIGLNFESAYTLLPSQRYFQDVGDPVITFNLNASFTDEWRAYWGPALGAYLEFFAFATGGGVTRTPPLFDELRIPEVLRPDLMQNADAFHTEFDTYQIPSPIRVVQIAGWGVPTTKTVEYKNWHFIFDVPVQSYGTIPTIEGDRTVVFASAISSPNSENYYVNLERYRREIEAGAQHRNLLSTQPIQGVLNEIMNNVPILETSYVTLAKPVPTVEGDRLVVSTHSPVILGAHDAQGNFTGVNEGQDMSLQFLFTSEGIPGSAFVESTDTQSIFLPKTGTYTLIYSGIGDGPTTLTIEGFSNDTVTPIAIYTDIPTTASTTATFVLNTADPAMSEISVDQNGDGTVDLVVSADSEDLTLGELIVRLRDDIANLDANAKIKKELLKQVKKIEKKITKSKLKKASKMLVRLSKQVTKLSDKGKVSDVDAQKIFDLLNQIDGMI